MKHEGSFGILIKLYDQIEKIVNTAVKVLWDPNADGNYRDIRRRKVTKSLSESWHYDTRPSNDVNICSVVLSADKRPSSNIIQGAVIQR